MHAANLTLRTRAWNDSKITAHHAIIPTTSSAGASHLTTVERAVYDLVARRYLAQFCGAYEFATTRLELVVAGERFCATGRRVKCPGWRCVEQPSRPEHQEAESRDETDGNVSLPPLVEGDAATAVIVTVAEKKTTPPKAFTDASLIQAMCHISRYVDNPAIKRILADTDGIGTPATRAAIIETLFERGFVARKKKNIVATPTGRALVEALPSVATRPDMTAIWEAAMRAIHQKEQSLDAFLACVRVELTRLVDQGKALGLLTLQPSARPTGPQGSTPASPQVHRRASRSGTRRSARQ
jgi:DNA topoisomerase-3